MAITPETVALVAQMRLAVDTLTDDQVRGMTKAWVAAWDTVAAEFVAALDELIQIGGDRWPSRAQIQRATRAQKALDVAGRALDTLASQASKDIADAARKAVAAAEAAQRGIVASQLPPRARVSFGRVPEDQLAAIVARTAERVHSLTRPLSADAVEAMRTELVRGMAMGDNPLDVARAMVARVEGAFNGGLTRAAVIARTELLDAHRAAAMASQLRNSGVLNGWVWLARLSKSTCVSCWARHGSIHPLDEPGPLDHQAGRCSRAPVTKSWKDLGFDIPEPASVIPDAQAAFNALPKADQLAVMGQARLDALRNGRVSWADLSRLKRNPGWRDSYVTVPVKDLASRS
jgi:hypothetical protein